MPPARLVTRLMAIAAGGAGCLSERPSTAPNAESPRAPAPPPSATSSAPPDSSAPVEPPRVAAPAPTAPLPAPPASVGTAAPSVPDEPEKDPNRLPPAPGASGACANRMACVPGSWCAHLIPGREKSYLGQPSETCRCTASGRFACPAVSSLSVRGSRVCVPKVGATCAARGSAAAEAAIRVRFRIDQCPVFEVLEEPTVARNGAGKEECCYAGDFHLCLGRPLWIAGTQRRSTARLGAWGGGSV